MLKDVSILHKIFQTSTYSDLSFLLANAEVSSLNLKQVTDEIDYKILDRLRILVPDVMVLPTESMQANVQQMESGVYSDNDYEWLVEVVKGLADIVKRNMNDNFTKMTETDYSTLDSVLKELIYIVGDNDEHPLAPLMDFIGILTTIYEQEHFLQLTDITTKSECESELYD